jgi:hypothetical protein
MDIKELDKKQLILLTLLITFVVSIATGIVTVSLMNQMPKSVPQTINNVIQRTIEKVTTVEVPNNDYVTGSGSSRDLSITDGDTLVNIYLKDAKILNINNTDGSNTISIDNSIGNGVIISDVGLILVDSNIITSDDIYKVVLDKKEFSASVLKKFTNGFTILKISSLLDKTIEDTVDNKNQITETKTN